MLFAKEEKKTHKKLYEKKISHTFVHCTNKSLNIYYLLFSSILIVIVNRLQVPLCSAEANWVINY